MALTNQQLENLDRAMAQAEILAARVRRGVTRYALGQKSDVDDSLVDMTQEEKDRLETIIITGKNNLKTFVERIP